MVAAAHIEAGLTRDAIDATKHRNSGCLARGRFCKLPPWACRRLRTLHAGDLARSCD